MVILSHVQTNFKRRTSQLKPSPVYELLSNKINKDDHVNMFALQLIVKRKINDYERFEKLEN